MSNWTGHAVGRIGIAGIALVCLTALGWTSAQAERKPRFGKGVREAYLQMSFSDETEAARRAGPEVGLGSGGLLADYDVLETDLSPAEACLINGCSFGKGSTMSLNATLAAVIAYESKFGELPMDGADLLAMYGDLFSAEGLNAFKQLPRLEQLQLAYRGLNPVNGKCFQDFQKSDWRPLSIYVHKLGGAEGVKGIPMVLSAPGSGDSKLRSRPFRVWEVVVFGETPGRELIRKEIYRMMGDGA
jgi:hypothetical protein